MTSRVSSYFDEAPGGGLLSRLYTRTGLMLLGLLAIALMASGLGLTVAVFTHAFANPAVVTLEVDRAGSQLSNGADVKVDGIVVGRVSAISANPDGSGATLRLALDRGQLHLIPANVTAAVLPKTVFGEKYVDLRLPATPVAARIAAGDVIARDRSSVAIETSTVLNNLEPLLTAVRPEELSATLTAIATGLRGQGTQLGDLLSEANTYTRGVRPTVDEFLADSKLLSDVGDEYTEVSAPLLRTLQHLTVTSRTLSAKQKQLAALLSGTNAFAYQTGELVQAVGGTAVEVVRVSQPILELLRKYSPELACTLRGVVEAKSRLEAVFADGPYLKARLFVSVSRGMYKPGIDAPKALDLSSYGPYCPVTPSTNHGKPVSFPPVPTQLDEIRGHPQLLQTVDGLPGIPVELSLPGGAAASGGTGSDTTSAPGSLLTMLLGGVLG
ncbi:MAG TPA: MCE family protein [Marmoricola sp.]|nr:MCE family protein [Marmoricola sp.]